MSVEGAFDGRGHAVFLRALNVGNRRIARADLRAVFAEVGYPGVATFQAAGGMRTTRRSFRTVFAMADRMRR